MLKNKSLVFHLRGRVIGFGSNVWAYKDNWTNICDERLREVFAIPSGVRKITIVVSEDSLDVNSASLGQYDDATGITVNGFSYPVYPGVAQMVEELLDDGYGWVTVYY